MSSVSAVPAVVPPNNSASSSGDISISPVWEVAAVSCSVVTAVPVVIVTSGTVTTARSDVAGSGCDGLVLVPGWDLRVVPVFPGGVVGTSSSSYGPASAAGSGVGGR